MTDKELQSEEKNLLASVQFLKQENDREAVNLSETVSKKRKAETEFKEIVSKIEKAKKLLDEIISSDRDLHSQISARRDQMKNEEVIHRNTLRELKDQEKQGIKTLNRLNQAIITAESDMSTSHSKLSDLEGRIAEKTKAAEGIEAMRDEIIALEKVRDGLRDEYSTVMAEMDKNLRIYHSELEMIRKEAEEKQKEASEAEERKIAFDNEYTNKKHNLETYASRVETHYKRAFPDLRMNL